MIKYSTECSLRIWQISCNFCKRLVFTSKLSCLFSLNGASYRVKRQIWVCQRRLFARQVVQRGAWLTGKKAERTSSPQNFGRLWASTVRRYGSLSCSWETWNNLQVTKFPENIEIWSIRAGMCRNFLTPGHTIEDTRNNGLINVCCYCLGINHLFPQFSIDLLRPGLKFVQAGSRFTT